MTGGHHSSALPIIHSLRTHRPDLEIVWIGHRHSLKHDSNDTLEYKEISALGIPFYDLQSGKIYKSLSIDSLKKVLSGISQAHKILKEHKPNVIMSFGGYLAAPVVLAGYFLKIPSLTHEQTSTVGYANRFIAIFADKIMISWPKSANYLPKKKVIFSGLPLRQSIFVIKSSSFKFENGLPTIFILAGKSGSTAVNEIIYQNLLELLNIANVIHQCGDYSVKEDFKILTKRYSEIAGNTKGKYALRKFIFEEEIGEAFQTANLIISRSGAHAICEILAVNKPALLIPIAWASHNEQFENALIVKNAGLGEILEEKDLTEINFIERVKFMIKNLQHYKNQSAINIREISKNSVELITKEILKYEKTQY